MEAFADVVRAGQGALHRRLGVARRGDPGGARAGPRAADPAGLQPAAVLDALAGHRGRGRADLRGARHRPDRLVADRAGRADRQVPAGPAAAGGLARDRREGRRRHDQPLAAATTCSSGCSSSSRSPTRPACRWPSSRSPGCCRTPTSRPRSSAPPGPSRSATTSRRPAYARAGDAEGDRRGRRPGRRARPGEDPVAAEPGLLSTPGSAVVARAAAARSCTCGFGSRMNFICSARVTA